MKYTVGIIQTNKLIYEEISMDYYCSSMYYFLFATIIHKEVSALIFT